MSQLGRRALLGGLLLAAVVLVAPTPATSVTPADPAIAVLAPPPIPIDPQPEPEPEPTTVAQAAPPVNYAAEMVQAAQNAAPKGITLGVAVLDVQTGHLEVQGADEFYSASLSKLMLVVDMLDRDVDLSETDHTLITRALSRSDDNAMNSLWVKFDGYDAMTRVAETLGMAGTETTDDPSQWGEVEVSPAGYARLYQHILTEMSDDDRSTIVTALSAAQPTAADGFNQFFGLLGGSLDAYAKQGWMYYGNRLYLHSAGVVSQAGHDFAVVLMSIQSPASATARANLSEIAEALKPALPADS